MPRPLYLSPVVRENLGPSLRPSGATLTRRILDLAAPEPHHLILDAGCGPGASLKLLREEGFGRVLGLDCDRTFLTEAATAGQELVQADISRLPIADQTVALILCECVWNLTERRQTLAEFHRILRPGGILAITDIYVRAPHSGDNLWPIPCCFKGATDLPTVQTLFFEQGFSIDLLEDHSRLLRETAARFVFAHGSLHGFWLAVTGDERLADQACRASTTKPGLFLLLAKRSTP
jgi:ubiquinone/menaquinone biosynthesis C-methylase UbiE